MVIHNYDFTFIAMRRFNNTLTMIKDMDSHPSYKIIFYMGSTKEMPLLSCEEEYKDGVYHIYIPDVPTTTSMWTTTIKKQFAMMLKIVQEHNGDYVSIVIDGNAKLEVAAIALHQAIREYSGVLYLIEFCVGDSETRKVYERTVSPIYRG